MSNEKYDRYKALHSEYILRFIELHNYHQAFLDIPTFMGGAKVRKAISAMIKLEREMRKISLAVSSEHTKNVKDGLKAAKKERARIRALPKKRGRPKVNPVKVRNAAKGRPRINPVRIRNTKIGRPPKKGNTNDINNTN